MLTLYTSASKTDRHALFEAARPLIGTNTSLMSQLASILGVTIAKFNWSNININLDLSAIQQEPINVPMKTLIDKLTSRLLDDPAVDLWTFFMEYFEQETVITFNEFKHDFTWHSLNGTLLGGFFTAKGLRKVLKRFEKNFTGDSCLRLRLNPRHVLAELHTPPPSEPGATAESTEAEGAEISRAHAQNTHAETSRSTKHDRDRLVQPTKPVTHRTTSIADDTEPRNDDSLATQTREVDKTSAQEPQRGSQGSQRTPRKSLWKNSNSSKSHAPPQANQQHEATPTTDTTPAVLELSTSPQSFNLAAQLKSEQEVLRRKHNIENIKNSKLRAKEDARRLKEKELKARAGENASEIAGPTGTRSEADIQIRHVSSDIAQPPTPASTFAKGSGKQKFVGHCKTHWHKLYLSRSAKPQYISRSVDDDKPVSTLYKVSGICEGKHGSLRGIVLDDWQPSTELQGAWEECGHSQATLFSKLLTEYYDKG